MRGQGLDSDSEGGWGGGVKPPSAAAADVTAQLAFIANKLPINAGAPAGRGVVCSVHSSPSQTVVFAVQRTLLSAKYTFV